MRGLPCSLLSTMIIPTATPTAVAATEIPKSRDTGRSHPHLRRCYRDRKRRAAGAGKLSEESARPEFDPRPQVEMEYVPEKPNLGAGDPLLLAVFASVFEKFNLTDHTAVARVDISGSSIFFNIRLCKFVFYMLTMCLLKIQRGCG
ncbi:uncharacterized protein LOC123453138 [Hordeum vulgare subsp. vulgare]|uniref:uncharacterized protein LOC123453138 n=1 Tax=Hordeum vulgare subsp. vulgare TaxID=112509 RepID=UPI001D1A39E3|nr:uncharacterized protein LOC123453138 [Hordeum vulgare subsp. vulgare]